MVEEWREKTPPLHRDDPEQRQPGVGGSAGKGPTLLLSRVFLLVLFHHCPKSCLQMGCEPTGIILWKNVLQPLFTFLCKKKNERN